MADSTLEQQFPAISYTDRDFNTILAALTQHIRRKFPSDWKDFRKSPVGQAFMELVAWVFDNLSYYLDIRANESFLPTARDRLSVINLCRLIGYRLSPATSASILVTCTIETAQSRDVIIAAGTAFISRQGVPFEFLAEGRITAGSLTNQVLATQGATQNDSFTSNGSAFQQFKLTQAQVLADTVVVLVNTVEWTEEESLVFGDETSTIFEVFFDEDDFGYIRFGDGISGFIPPESSVIEVTYRIGGGVQGNLPLNEIEQTISGTLSGIVPEVAVEVMLTNPDEVGSGGNERESLDHAKFFAPKSVKTNGRAVTREDFETLAALFSDPVVGAPAAAGARLKQKIPELNTVEVFLWGRDSAGDISEPGTSLIAAVQAYFDNNDAGAVRIVSVDTEVQAGEIVYVDVAVRVRPSTAFSTTDVLNNVAQAIRNYFDGITTQPGEDVRLSQLYDAIMAATGVRYANITNIRATLKVEETVGTGDGTTQAFSWTLDHSPVPFSILVTAGDQVLADNGVGGFTGPIDPVGTNEVDYFTGVGTVTFLDPPATGAAVVVEYRYITTYQRGELEQVANGISATFTGTLDFPPAVPGTVALSDGTRVVIDDGQGNLIGDVYEAGTIDYDSGYYNFTFNAIPPEGARLHSTYVQLLSTASQDLPITKQQLAVKSLITVVDISEDTTD